jgi:hypothetical protein
MAKQKEINRKAQQFFDAALDFTAYLDEPIMEHSEMTRRFLNMRHAAHEMRDAAETATFNASSMIAEAFKPSSTSSPSSSEQSSSEAMPK